MSFRGSGKKSTCHLKDLLKNIVCKHELNLVFLTISLQSQGHLRVRVKKCMCRISPKGLLYANMNLICLLIREFWPVLSVLTTCPSWSRPFWGQDHINIHQWESLDQMGVVLKYKVNPFTNIIKHLRAKFFDNLTFDVKVRQIYVSGKAFVQRGFVFNYKVNPFTDEEVMSNVKNFGWNDGWTDSAKTIDPPSET